jgi:hypothetical protein
MCMYWFVLGSLIFAVTCMQSLLVVAAGAVMYCMSDSQFAMKGEHAIFSHRVCCVLHVLSMFM